MKDILLYDLVDLGGNIERTEAMTEEEVKEENKKLWWESHRLIQWIVSNNNWRYVRYRIKYPNELNKNKRI